MSDPIPTHERTTTVNDNSNSSSTPDWDGALVVEDSPAPAPEPRTLTWRRDGTGCTWDELVAEFREGRQVERVIECSEVTITRRGPLERGQGNVWRIGGIYSIRRYNGADSVTVWLPEVPEWAQDYNTQSFDLRAVVTDDRRVWRPLAICRREIQEWRGTDGDDTKTTEELVAMGAHLLIDRDGKAVL